MRAGMKRATPRDQKQEPEQVPHPAKRQQRRLSLSQARVLWTQPVIERNEVSGLLVHKNNVQFSVFNSANTLEGGQRLHANTKTGEIIREPAPFGCVREEIACCVKITAQHGNVYLGCYHVSADAELPRLPNYIYEPQAHKKNKPTLLFHNKKEFIIQLEQRVVSIVFEGHANEAIRASRWSMQLLPQHTMVHAFMQDKALWLAARLPNENQKLYFFPDPLNSSCLRHSKFFAFPEFIHSFFAVSSNPDETASAVGVVAASPRSLSLWVVRRRTQGGGFSVKDHTPALLSELKKIDIGPRRLDLEEVHGDYQQLAVIAKAYGDGLPNWVVLSCPF